MADCTLVAMRPLAGVPNLQSVSWVVAVAILCSCSLAFFMGANDVANAFATSVGSGVLTLLKAVMVAAVFNFAGSMSLGAEVSKTIASKIVDVSAFSDAPHHYMLGMFTSLIAASAMVCVATVFGLPVSTTQAVVGAIAGFAMVERSSAVKWYPEMMQIVLSWVVSPILAGAVSAAMYWVTRQLVLRQPDLQKALRRQKVLVALIIGFTLALVTIFVGFRETERGSEYDYIIPLTALGVFLLFTAASYFLLVPLLFASSRMGSIAPHATESAPLLGKQQQEPSNNLSETVIDTGAGISPSSEQKPKLAISGASTEESSTDSEAKLLADQSEATKALHAKADHFNAQLEHNFSLVQILTACYMSYAHGAGDVANAAGPLIAVWSVYEAGNVDAKVEPKTWIIALGGLSICAGMLLFGKRVIETMGKQMTRITPSRGYSVELGTSTAVMIATFLSIPVSTTQCAVGSIVAVGLVNSSGLKAVKWTLTLQVFASWVCTVLFAALVGAGLYAALLPTVRGLGTPPAYPGAQLVWANGTCTIN